MVNSLLSADTRFAVKDGHRLFALSPKTDLHSTISTDCSSIGKVHFNPLLSGSVIAFGSTPIASRAPKNAGSFLAVNAFICYFSAQGRHFMLSALQTELRFPELRFASIDG